MIERKILLSMISALLTTTITLNAKAGDCAGGVCFVNLDKNKPSKKFENQNQNLVALEMPRYIETKETEEDKTITIVLDGEIITVFPHASYVMSEEEKRDFYYNNKIYEEVDSSLVLVTEGDGVENIEEKILDKVHNLPVSEYFCEKDKQPLYHLDSGLYECV